MPTQFVSWASRNYVSALKLLGIALFFAPMWGLAWHKVNAAPEEWMASWAFQLFARQIDWGNPVRAVLYAIAYAFSLLGILAIPILRSNRIRITLVIVLMAGWTFEHFFLEMNGLFTNRDLISLLWDERRLTGDAAFAFRFQLLHNLLLAVLIGVIFCLPPRSPLSLSRRWALLPALGFVLVGCLVTLTKTLQTFPVPYAALANGLTDAVGLPVSRPFGYYTSQNIVRGRNIELPFQPAHQFKKIIMVTDESVRGDYLSLNNPEVATTPFLESEARFINFGIAISGGNCSSISRTIFRYGMRPEHLPNDWDKGAKTPLIWQYASHAGYRTVHLDGTAAPLQFHNGFSAKEKELIDTEISVTDLPEYVRDNIIADKMLTLLTGDTPLFLFVDKHGVHFPYELRHPPENADNPAKTRVDHYKLGITWSVDEFFRKLMPKLDLSNTLLIYTSDHGQNFDLGLPHCTVAKDVSRTEAMVPLFAATGDRQFEQRLRQEAKVGFDRMSHFEIFPTLLVAMGYDENAVKSAYGPSMLDGPGHDARSFLIGVPYLNPHVIVADQPASH